MMRNSAISPEFVELIPEDLRSGVLYISRKYKTAVHRCLCGCGRKVVTPLSATDWQLTVRGGKISLYPSIGNWSSPCRSHYWIDNNTVEWSTDDWTDSRVAASRRFDKAAKDNFYSRGQPNRAPVTTASADNLKPQPSVSWWGLIKEIFN